MIAAPAEPCPAADTGICSCATCAHERRHRRLREACAAALHCPVRRVCVSVYHHGPGWVAAMSTADLSVSYAASSPEDAAQGVLSAITGTLDLG